MPLPSREQTFALADCRELLQKLDRELDRYREVMGGDETEPEALLELVDQLKDSAFNASVTAWQLCDWVFNDMTPEQRQKLGFTKLSDLQAHVRKIAGRSTYVGTPRPLPSIGLSAITPILRFK